MMFKKKPESRSEDMRRVATDSMEDERDEVGKRLMSCPAIPLPMIFWMKGMPVTAASESVEGGMFW
jgi:hypothetical protein